MPGIKVLFLMHVPPPVHGASMVGSFIKNSPLINDAVDPVYINLATTSQLDQTGKAGLGKILTFGKLLLNVFKTLRTEKLDLCYMTLTSSGAGFYKDLLFVVLIKSFGVKLLYHFHNKGVANASASGINRMLYRYVFKQTQSILLSPYLYPDIREFVKEADVFYCPNGIPKVNNATRRDSSVGKCRLLYLSNMMQEKGAYVLLDALKELKNRGLEFAADFVGGWSDITATEFNRKLNEAGLSEFVVAHGPRYGGDKEIFFNQADVFVFPTFYHYEAFPLVLLEAMQYSLPVVSTKEGGIPEIVLEGKTGFLATQKDALLLAEKLETLIKNPELRADLGKRGKERFEAHFTLPLFEKRMLEILYQAAQ